MRTSQNYHLPLPEGSDEMLIEKVSQGIETLDTQLGITARSLQNISTQLTQLGDEVCRLKSSIGNIYLSDAIQSLDIEVIRKQYGGHSEYEIYDICCSRCRTRDGEYIVSSGKLMHYGDRNYSSGNFVIAVNPDALIVAPVTPATLDNILYVGKTMPEGYIGLTILESNDPHSWNIGEEDGFVEYDTLYESIEL